MKHRIGDKCRRHQGNIHPRAVLQHLAAKVEHHIQNDRRHTGLHPLEQQGNIVVGGKGVVEHRDDREDDHGRNDGPQHRHEHPDQSLYLPAHQNRRIDGDGTRRGLRQRCHIQHFLFIDPVQLIYKFFLHKGHDDKAAAEGKAANVQRTQKQLPKPCRPHTVCFIFIHASFLLLFFISDNYFGFIGISNSFCPLLLAKVRVFRYPCFRK